MKWCSIFGEVSVREQIWRNLSTNYLRVFAKRIGVRPRGRSLRLERVLTDFGCEHSFARAAQSVLEHYGIEVGATCVHDCTLKHAQRAQAQLQKQYEQTFRLLPAQGEPYVIAQADGTMICTVQPAKRRDKRPREWKEMRLVASQAKGSTTTIYAATFGTVEQTGRRWGHCAKAAGWGLNSRIHVVGDGADWIRGQTREVFGDQGSFLCDFFHVSEYLGAAAQTCRPAKADQWRHIQQKRLRRGAFEKVIESLEDHLEPANTPEELSPVRNAHRYLSNRRECLDYPRALELDLPIGSGIIESGHRHVLQARLKKAGAAWLQPHADSIAHLRVMRANQKWSSLWN